MSAARPRRAGGSPRGLRPARQEARPTRAASLAALACLAACEPRASSASASAPEPPVAVAPAAAPTRAEPADAELEPSLRELEPCLPVDYEICFNALDDNCNGALEEGCGVPAGVVQFMIGWDALRADVDLNVTDPNGELIEAGRVVQSGLIKSRDCPGRRQECSGVNLENVFLEGNKAPTRGTYRVSVALESLGGEEPPIWVNLSSRLGSRRYAFEVRLISPEDERHVELSL
jgi:tRNA (guanosine-2'-O-)-methyltransferase